MKRLILSLALLLSFNAAHAAVLAVAKNKLYGTVYLTTVKDDCVGDNLSYSITDRTNNIVDHGCYMIPASIDIVVFASEQYHNAGVWSLSDFNLVRR